MKKRKKTKQGSKAREFSENATFALLKRKPNESLSGKDEVKEKTAKEIKKKNKINNVKSTESRRQEKKVVKDIKETI